VRLRLVAAWAATFIGAHGELLCLAVSLNCFPPSHCHLAWNHLLGGICRGASFTGPGAFTPFPGFAVLSLAAILALMMVFPDLFFRRPLASLSTATMRDFSIVVSCLLGQRFANDADEVRE
jgi:hypothetical protein